MVELLKTNSSLESSTEPNQKEDRGKDREGSVQEGEGPKMACSILQLLLDGSTCSYLRALLGLKSAQSAQPKLLSVPKHCASPQKICPPCQKKGETFSGIDEQTQYETGSAVQY